MPHLGHSNTLRKEDYFDFLCDLFFLFVVNTTPTLEVKLQTRNTERIHEKHIVKKSEKLSEL